MALAETVTSGVNTTMAGIFYFFLFCIVIGIIIFALEMSKYKYRITIREVLSDGRKLISIDKAKEVNKKGQKYWKTLKTKLTLPIPHQDAIDIDTKGKKCVELYLNQKGEPFWIKDNTKLSDNGNIINGEFEPLETGERDLLITRIERAQERKGKGWKDQIVPLAALGAIVILVVCLMVFWGDLAKPVLEQGKTMVESKKTDLAIIEALDRIENNVQVLAASQGVALNNQTINKPK